VEGFRRSGGSGVNSGCFAFCGRFHGIPFR